MDRGARIEDYKVTVGHEECVVSDLLTDVLTFVPPADEPDDAGLHSQDGGKIVKVSCSRDKSTCNTAADTLLAQNSRQDGCLNMRRMLKPCTLFTPSGHECKFFL